ncbi:MAG: hypothetical protein ABIW82_07740 [Dokdonella sp.]
MGAISVYYDGFCLVCEREVAVYCRFVAPRTAVIPGILFAIAVAVTATARSRTARALALACMAHDPHVHPAEHHAFPALPTCGLDELA